MKEIINSKRYGERGSMLISRAAGCACVSGTRREKSP